MSPSAPQEPTVDMVAAFCAGDAGAWQRIDARYRKRLALLLRGRIPKSLKRRFDTEDIVQSAILSAFKEIDSFEDRGPDSFRRWMMTILWNGLRSRVRFHKAGVRDIAQEINEVNDSDGLNPMDLASNDKAAMKRAEDLEATLQAIATLDDKKSDLIRRRFLDEQTFEEMAKQDGVSVRTICRRVSNIIVELRRKS